MLRRCKPNKPLIFLVRSADIRCITARGLSGPRARTPADALLISRRLCVPSLPGDGGQRIDDEPNNPRDRMDDSWDRVDDSWDRVDDG